MTRQSECTLKRCNVCSQKWRGEMTHRNSSDSNLVCLLPGTAAAVIML